MDLSPTEKSWLRPCVHTYFAEQQPDILGEQIWRYSTVSRIEVSEQPRSADKGL